MVEVRQDGALGSNAGRCGAGSLPSHTGVVEGQQELTLAEVCCAVLCALLVSAAFVSCHAALPTLDIAEGALNKLIDTYKQLLPQLGGYLTHAGARGGSWHTRPAWCLMWHGATRG